MRKAHKLYTLTPDYFRAYSHRDSSGNLITQSANAVPMICWPDGRWCFEANCYIQSCYLSGVSRRDRGGTLLTYTAQISELIRFCYDQKTQFHELTDVLFSEFIKKLGISISTNSVIAYGRRCLDFLYHTGQLYNIENFLGYQGQIFAFRKPYKIRLSGKGKWLERSCWHHSSFPVNQGTNRRLPISDENSQRLRDAILDVSSSVFIRRRRYVMLDVFEISGARRYEVCHLKVEDILAAASMNRPQLKFITAKKRNGMEATRYIPVSQLDLRSLLDHIKYNRTPIIKKTIGIKNDHGYFFISENTGKKLAVNTLTQEIHTLRLAANIEEAASPHMYRHAYLSKLLMALKEQHCIDNPDDFRKILIDNEGLLTEILQYSGHSSIESLMIYIHQATGSKDRVKKTVTKVLAISAIEKLENSLIDAEIEIDNLSPKESKKILKEIIKSAKKDLKPD